MMIFGAKVGGGWSALHYAAQNGHGGVVEVLLKAGCNPDMLDKV